MCVVSVYKHHGPTINILYCRPVDGILGFTRETIVALTTNIESREWKRRQYSGTGHRAENPRSSTTDDVECFFSVMRDMVGKHFTVRQVRYNWRKVCAEFTKRLDPDLGFFYHTAAHDRFYEGERQRFDVPSKKVKRRRVRKREQLAQLVCGRATLAIPGARSI